MTRIGPAAAARTCCKAAANTAAIHRTRRAMCAVCNGDRPTCPRSQSNVQLHIEGAPCPRGWHPDKRGRVNWHGAWSGVPDPLRLYLAAKVGKAKRDRHGGWRGFYRSFAGCGCNRAAKAAWKRWVRKWRKLG